MKGSESEENKGGEKSPSLGNDDVFLGRVKTNIVFIVILCPTM